jgi:hypothetical protein
VRFVGPLQPATVVDAQLLLLLVCLLLVRFMAPAPAGVLGNEKSRTGVGPRQFAGLGVKLRLWLWAAVVERS